MKKDKKYWFVIGIIALILIIDQTAKIYFSNITQEISIYGIAKFSYVENTGGAFGIFNESRIGIILLNVIVLGLIIKFMSAQKERIDNKTLVALALILGGGISNLADRLVRGYVVDYINIEPLFKFPVFNIADIALCIGWVLLIIFIITYSFKDNNKQKAIKGE